MQEKGEKEHSMNSDEKATFWGFQEGQLNGEKSSHLVTRKKGCFYSDVYPGANETAHVVRQNPQMSLK